MAKLDIRRQQESELPATLRVEFANRGAAYQAGVQAGRRLAVQSSQVSTVSLPLALSDGEARVIAEKLLYAAWVSRTTFSFRLGRKYTYLEPTDVISVQDTSTGATHVMRLTGVTYNGDGSIEVKAVADDSSVYSQTATSGSSEDATYAVQLKSGTRCVILDAPLLRDLDSESGVYVAMSGFTSTWKGAGLHASDDNQTYTKIASASVAAVIGTATTVLGNWTGGNVFDEANTVTVKLLTGTLASATEANVLRWANLAMVGKEVIQFKTATLTGTRTYVLSGLLRGRRGTEDYISTHASGDTFVLLPVTTPRVSIGASDLGVRTTYKAVTSGRTLQATSPFYQTIYGRSTMPLAPVALAGGKQSNGDFYVEWKRRTRRGGEWMPNVDAPLSETSESYEVRVMLPNHNISAITKGTTTTITTADAHGFTTGWVVHIYGVVGPERLNEQFLSVTVLNTTSFTVPFDTTLMDGYLSGGVVAAYARSTIVAGPAEGVTPSWTYTQATQVTDWGSERTSLNLRIFQISSTVGRGVSLRGSL